MAKWDVTTAEGREALERFLMEQMGYRRVTGEGGVVAWVNPEGGVVAVPEGWIYTGDGMVRLKLFVAEKHSWSVKSFFDSAGAGVDVLDELGHSLGWGGLYDEPTATALALARALEKMGE